ncbi:uncharacterized protein CCOS01_08959 [Colletotrichum costaricense]|uniref:Uncharacterized protein n=1 Tax=Colletotrichum costaricense TaxID=1209916 RepID=A0AAJ0DYQ6_9PEZI|nr:uncharacterized protein CCOS01_08959 [Colletotrichum costaricense]KAK1523872.1 hypothetical protein CCOS01_08959 [Colletotrichum costaricense]
MTKQREVSCSAVGAFVCYLHVPVGPSHQVDTSVRQVLRTDTAGTNIQVGAKAKEELEESGKARGEMMRNGTLVDLHLAFASCSLWASLKESYLRLRHIWVARVACLGLAHLTQENTTEGEAINHKAHVVIPSVSPLKRGMRVQCAPKMQVQGDTGQNRAESGFR